MKFKKSKPQTVEVIETPNKTGGVFFGTKKETTPLTAKELKLLSEEKARIKIARQVKIKKVIGKFFTVLFIVAVIFSMVIVPLLIVFG